MKLGVAAGGSVGASGLGSRVEGVLSLIVSDANATARVAARGWYQMEKWHIRCRSTFSFTKNTNTNTRKRKQ